MFAEFKSHQDNIFKLKSFLGKATDLKDPYLMWNLNTKADEKYSSFT